MPRRTVRTAGTISLRSCGSVTRLCIGSFNWRVRAMCCRRSVCPSRAVPRRRLRKTIPGNVMFWRTGRAARLDVYCGSLWWRDVRSWVIVPLPKHDDAAFDVPQTTPTTSWRGGRRWRTS